MHLQKAVLPFDRFVRCIGLGPQTRVVQLRPGRAAARPLHAWTATSLDAEGSQSELEDITLTINAFFGWDFNSCEALRKDGVWHPIDFANACPDSQVTSLHYHFPWLVKANLRWSIFCAATRRRVRKNLDWEPFFEIAARGPAVSREAAPLRADRPRRRSTRTRSRSSARSTSRTSTRWPGSSSAPSRRATRCARRSRRCSRRTRSSEFTELFSGASSAGVPRRRAS